MRNPPRAAGVIPPTPRPGDTLGIVAPGSAVTKELLDKGCTALRRAGFKTTYLDSILDKDLYFAGGRERRRQELETMFTRDDIAGIVCARGGYGCNHVLPLDLDVVRRHPKFFMGYSDITTLLTYMTDHADLVTYHGPMVAKDFAEGHAWPDVSGRIESDVEGLAAGSAEGVLYGGCLSMLASSLGTPYQVKTAGTILFIEDVNTKPFQVDRMLMQLRLAGCLNEVRGFIFGQMLDCVQPGGQDYTLQEVIQRTLEGLDVPIAYGVPFGHLASPPNLVLPLGIKVSMSVSANHLSVSAIGHE